MQIPAKLDVSENMLDWILNCCIARVCSHLMSHTLLQPTNCETSMILLIDKGSQFTPRGEAVFV